MREGKRKKKMERIAQKEREKEKEEIIVSKRYDLALFLYLKWRVGREGI